jgi:hypothetical protein
MLRGAGSLGQAMWCISCSTIAVVTAEDIRGLWVSGIQGDEGSRIEEMEQLTVELMDVPATWDVESLHSTGRGMVCLGPNSLGILGIGVCYGRWTIVSDVDGEGFALNVDGRKVQDLDYIEVRTTEPRDKHTRGDDEMTVTLQSMPMSEREVQGLSKVRTGMDV